LQAVDDLLPGCFGLQLVVVDIHICPAHCTGQVDDEVCELLFVFKGVATTLLLVLLFLKASCVDSS
jgi:hypothetical protein